MAEQILSQAKFSSNQQFNSTYCEKDFFQRQIHATHIPRFVSIIKRKYLQSKKPVSILDFCCGYGTSTFQMIKELLDQGVELDKVVGYDLSHDLIQKAIRDNPYPQYLSFQQKNLDFDLDDVEEYDFVINIFGLHWMNHTEKVIEDISRCLKNGGIFLSLTTIQHHELLKFREDFIRNSKWKYEFEQGYKIPKFHDSDQYYLQYLNKHFKTIGSRFPKQHCWFSEELFGYVLESYLQEIRHIVRDQKSTLKKSIISQNYIKQFLKSIPSGYNGEHLLRKNRGFEFGCFIHYYQGVKINKQKNAQRMK